MIQKTVSMNKVSIKKEISQGHKGSFRKLVVRYCTLCTIPVPVPALLAFDTTRPEMSSRTSKPQDEGLGLRVRKGFHVQTRSTQKNGTKHNTGTSFNFNPFSTSFPSCPSFPFCPSYPLKDGKCVSVHYYGPAVVRDTVCRQFQAVRCRATST